MNNFASTINDAIEVLHTQLKDGYTVSISPFSPPDFDGESTTAIFIRKGKEEHKIVVTVPGMKVQAGSEVDTDHPGWKSFKDADTLKDKLIALAWCMGVTKEENDSKPSKSKSLSDVLAPASPRKQEVVENGILKGPIEITNITGSLSAEVKEIRGDVVCTGAVAHESVLPHTLKKIDGTLDLGKISTLILLPKDLVVTGDVTYDNIVFSGELAMSNPYLLLQRMQAQNVTVQGKIRISGLSTPVGVINQQLVSQRMDALKESFPQYADKLVAEDLATVGQAPAVEPAPPAVEPEKPSAKPAEDKEQDENAGEAAARKIFTKANTIFTTAQLQNGKSIQLETGLYKDPVLPKTYNALWKVELGNATIRIQFTTPDSFTITAYTPEYRYAKVDTKDPQEAVGLIKIAAEKSIFDLPDDEKKIRYIAQISTRFSRWEYASFEDVYSIHTAFTGISPDTREKYPSHSSYIERLVQYGFGRALSEAEGLIKNKETYLQEHENKDIAYLLQFLFSAIKEPEGFATLEQKTKARQVLEKIKQFNNLAEFITTVQEGTRLRLLQDFNDLGEGVDAMDREE